MKPGLSEIPDDWKAFGSSPCSSRPGGAAPTHGPGRAQKFRRPATAWNSLGRENHARYRSEDAEHDLADDDVT